MLLQLETNIDDMDPRLWPHVIEQLLDAGALDAWATPILMKKGRPAFTLSALCDADAADAVRAAVFRETTTIGLREFSVERKVLDRVASSVTVGDETIAIKTAFDASQGVAEANTSIEWDDVVRVSQKLGLSAKQVLAAATAAAVAAAE